jgi:hypothetical protein
MTEHPRLIVAGDDGTERSFTIARRCSAPYLAELIGEVAPSLSHSPNRANGSIKSNVVSQAGLCCCGEPLRLGVVHRSSRPCFCYLEETTELTVLDQRSPKDKRK